MEKHTLLKINDLVVEYAANKKIVQAVNGVSLSLNKGETLGLVGETGAGKTTIAKAILRILPDPPAKVKGGEIWFEGEDLLKLSDRKMSHIKGNEISMIFQDPMTALNPIMTVGKQIAETIRLHNKISKAEAQTEAVKMLEMVGIPGERYSEYPHQFSGGMKQRVIIAMALACKPKLLLADEPTTALDVTIQAQVLEMMNELKKELDTSVLLITHDLGVVAEMCEKVAVIYAGEVVEYGAAEDVFDNTAHPYTKGLFQSLPKLDSKETRLKPIKGMMPDPTELPEGCKFSERCPYATEECKKRAPKLMELKNGHYALCSRIGEI
ncbi:dipeptide/oligopeptide/nickel ABC transporter ATP-binding protein [Mediterraneibacter gnavus]|uniref:Dipeptide/oligopeptide/nickel ABC transporter ATP-binding protein n=1 Tax=Mediterraneibacter gnavus TaxID=33038 RepID=A0A2N5PC74_MEDGN|nr:ABC transporter ATP-binding protein [Mediterraneibacter gnavus]PLT72739.1 dipeptide/oligopeptide/nickel ABC transporter ATP-binding protein [Mediterraneibacter gnavus]